MEQKIKKNSQELDLIIIGGGIAGSSAALFAREQGLNFLLLEAEEKLGGVIQSGVSFNQEEQSYFYEKGANTLKLGQTLLTICQKLKVKLLGSSLLAKDKYLYLNGSLKKLSLKSLLIEQEILKNSDKLKALKFLFRPVRLPRKEKKDFSVSKFFRLNFSQRILDNLIWAILNGIYAGNPYKLSLLSIFPQLYQIGLTSFQRKEPFLFSLIRFLSRKKQTPQHQQKSKSKYFTLEKGLGGLFLELEKELGKRVVLLSKVKKIKLVNLQRDNKKDNKKEIYLIETTNKKNKEQVNYLAKKIILATPPKEAAEIFPEFLDELKQISFAQVITVNLRLSGLAEKELAKIKKAFGFLCTREKKIRLLGMIYYSALFPREQNLFTCFLGGVVDREIFSLSKQEIEQVLKKDLGEIFSRAKNSKREQLEIEIISLNRWERAIPQYNVGHADLIARVKNRLPENLQLAGNYLKGASVEQAALSGREALFYNLRRK